MTRRIKFAVWVAGIFIGSLLLKLLMDSGGSYGTGHKGSDANEDQSQWIHAGSSIWTGVRLYFGEGQEKKYVGEVLGGNENYIDPYTGRKSRAIKIINESGFVEWKDRNVTVLDDWYIKRNDPALDKMEWHEYNY